MFRVEQIIDDDDAEIRTVLAILGKNGHSAGIESSRQVCDLLRITARAVYESGSMPTLRGSRRNRPCRRHDMSGSHPLGDDPSTPVFVETGVHRSDDYLVDGPRSVDAPCDRP